MERIAQHSANQVTIIMDITIARVMEQKFAIRAGMGRIAPYSVLLMEVANVILVTLVLEEKFVIHIGLESFAQYIVTQVMGILTAVLTERKFAIVGGLVSNVQSIVHLEMIHWVITNVMQKMETKFACWGGGGEIVHTGLCRHLAVVTYFMRLSRHLRSHSSLRASSLRL